MSSVSKLEKLTDGQLASMAEYRDEWTRIGLCTDPADRPAAERAIADMYRAAGLEPPRKIVWCGSPLSQDLTRAIVLDTSVRASVRDSVGDSVRASVWDSVGASVRASVGDSVRASVGDSVWASVGASVGDSVWASVGDSVRASVWASVGDSVWDSVGDSVWDSVGASVRASVWDSVRASVWDSVWASVGDSVWDSVWASVGASVWASVWASVGDSVWASVGDSVRASVYGSHDAGWLAFYRYFHDVCGLTEQTEKLAGFWGLARSAGWALPHAGICWVSERHQALARDDAGRLHSVSGPAVMYPDGWAIYAVRGVRVPREWVENAKELDPQLALTHANIEQRRAAAELIGWKRVIEQLQPRVVNRSRNPEIGTLLSVDLPDAPGSKFLQVQCGTKREFVLPVPAEMTTARAANAWTFGLEAKDLKLEIRT